MEEKRYDGWSPLIPKVGQRIQVSIGEIVFDTAVLTRTTKDKETFYITVSSPFPEECKMELYITPNASAVGLVDKANDLKPYWRISNIHGEDEDAKLFFFS